MKALQDQIHETAIRKSDAHIDSVVGSVDEIDRLIHRSAFESGFSHGVNWYVGHRKGLGIQEARQLVNQMLSEEISFSRFVELINEGSKI